MTGPLTIRRMAWEDDYPAIEDLQRRAWGFEDIEITPRHELMAVSRFHCGLVAGAFAGEKLVGFILAYETRDKTLHHSDMMAVDPKWQSGNREVSVGLALKEFHREVALAQGVNRIQWTFDPLMGKNANLNLRKLGAAITAYYPDFYGVLEAELYAGLATDRALITWTLENYPPEPRPERDLQELVLAENPEDIPDRPFRMLIPYDLDALKKKDMDAAQAFREKTGAIFKAALEQGFVADEFHTEKEAKENFYVFNKS